MSFKNKEQEVCNGCYKIIFKSFLYTRLSKEDRDRLERLKRENKADGNSLESNSIANQKKLIRDYISKQDDIILVGEYEDDGYTGTNFDRPGFIK